MRYVIALFAMVLAPSAFAEVYGGSLHYTFGGASRTYVPQQTQPSQAGAFASSQNAQLAAQTDALLQQAALGRMPAMPQFSASAAPYLQPQLQWLQTVNDRMADPINQRLVQAYAKAPMEAVVRHDPFTLAESLDGYLNNVSALERVDPRAARRLMDAGRGIFVDEQGIIANLGTTHRQVEILSPWGSENGRRVRSSVNRLMVAKEILEQEFAARCAAAGEEKCAQYKQTIETFRDVYDQMLLALQLADRAGLLGPLSPSDPMTHLQEMSEFYYSFAKNVFLGVKDMVVETAHFLRHPIDNSAKAVHGLAEAFRNRGAVWEAAKAAVRGKWRALLEGTPEEQGAIVGRVTTDVVTTVMPLAGAAGGAMKGIRALRAVEGISVAEKIGNLAKLGKASMLGAATERLARSAAVFEMAEDMVAAGNLSRVSANAVKAVGVVLPRTAHATLRSREAIATVTEWAAALTKESSGALALAAAKDARIASVIEQQTKPALALLKQFGPQALAGTGELMSQANVPSLLTDWSKAGLSQQLAVFGRQMTEVAGGLGVGESVASLRNLVTAARTLAKEAPLSENAYRFLIRYALNSEKVAKTTYTAEDLTRVAKSYRELEKAFHGVVPKTLGEVEVLRGMEAVPGRTIETVFDYQAKYNYPSNHRFSQPGEGGLYTTLLKDEQIAKDTIRLELKLNDSAPIIYDRKTVSLNRVLDLTDNSVLQKLGIKMERLLLEEPEIVRTREDFFHYELTHQIGSLAKQMGYDAIVSYSSKQPPAVTGVANRAKNVIILK